MIVPHYILPLLPQYAPNLTKLCLTHQLITVRVVPRTNQADKLLGGQLVPLSALPPCLDLTPPVQLVLQAV